MRKRRQESAIDIFDTPDVLDTRPNILVDPDADPDALELQNATTTTDTTTESTTRTRYLQAASTNQQPRSLSSYYKDLGDLKRVYVKTSQIIFHSIYFPGIYHWLNVLTDESVRY